MKMSCEVKVSEFLLKKISLGDKWIITSVDIKGKQVKQTLTVNGMCSTGVIDLS